MDETPLTGGRVTDGVVRVGDTVRRPPTANAPFVRELLTLLHLRGFEECPRHLGTDEQGREVFSFIPGDVPAELEPAFPDDVLADAARLIRRFHDATGGTVCHNDLSPCNVVFREGRPTAIIDFDAAGPGDVARDVGYAVFLWLNLGTDGPPATEQARRINVFGNAYGVAPNLDAVIEAVAANIVKLEEAGRHRDIQWWRRQHRWLLANRGKLAQ